RRPDLRGLAGEPRRQGAGAAVDLGAEAGVRLAGAGRSRPSGARVVELDVELAGAGADVAGHRQLRLAALDLPVDPGVELVGPGRDVPGARDRRSGRVGAELELVEVARRGIPGALQPEAGPLGAGARDGHPLGPVQGEREAVL